MNVLRKHFTFEELRVEVYPVALLYCQLRGLFATSEEVSALVELHVHRLRAVDAYGHAIANLINAADSATDQRKLALCQRMRSEQIGHIRWIGETSASYCLGDRQRRTGG